VLQELFCPGRADRGADCAGETVLADHQGDAVALEEYFCKSGAVLAGKASAADGLNLANSMVRVMDTIALGYGDMRSPSSVVRDYFKKYIKNNMLYYLRPNDKWRRFVHADREGS
jgi:hypothetical protein